MKGSNPKITVDWIELFLSGLGGAVCPIITYLIWRSIAPNQGMWLLPGLYFVELTAGSVICSLAYYLRHPNASTLSWIYSGILIVFIVLASFTVGFLYIPVFLIVAGLSVYSVVRHRQKLPGKLGYFVLSVLVQLALMLFFVRILA